MVENVMGKLVLGPKLPCQTVAWTIIATTRGFDDDYDCDSDPYSCLIPSPAQLCLLPLVPTTASTTTATTTITTTTTGTPTGSRSCFVG